MKLLNERMRAGKHLETVTKEQWCLFFRACDGVHGVPAGQMHGGDLVSDATEQVRQMPYFQLAKEWQRWLHTFYHQNFITAIEWVDIPETREPNWRPRDAAEALVALVLYVRRDRFVEGGLASNIRQGDVEFAISKLTQEFRPLDLE